MQWFSGLRTTMGRLLCRPPKALLLTCVVGFVLPAHGDWPATLDGAAGDPLAAMRWAVVPDEELAEQRGGLIRRDGFELALGIERTTAINGEVVAHTVLMDRSGVNVKVASGGMHIRNALDGLTVQALSGPNWASVVQNQLSNQIISNQTTLNVDLAGMNLNRMDMRRMLDAQMIQGLRGY
ncbi:hypothetical protein [Ectothiorhodospira marina]|uniref:Uncharacterized protein n=1 Tax=Ectothiorhodospira marina TaxID=1396821 RepID=A0A1H7GZT8_9GAMM|nr:hypothetical protein [Ectothiorhodospira marina]SEK43559.1 hypothetical protein SAMN05444515_10224 [Ectothiorhodospira marina]